MMLDRAAILLKIPHGEPFMFLDEAEICDKSASGRYRITGEEHFLAGHFPERPTFPASIMMEALGQLGVLYLLENTDLPPVAPDSIYFVKSEDTHCKRICLPGDCLEFRILRKICREPLITFSGEIRVENEVALKVSAFTLTFACIKSAKEAVICE